MQEQSNGQSVEQGSSGKPRGNFLVEFILKVCLPAAGCIVLANLIFGHFQHDNPQEAIRKAIFVHNYKAARILCEQEIRRDFFDLDTHRTHITCSREIIDRSDRKGKKSDVSINVEQEYEKYTQRNDPNIADVGYYGLGYYYSIQEKYSTAIGYFEKVCNKNLMFLNNSIGFAYLESGDIKKAEPYFYREIENGGNVDGAYWNLGRLYYKQKNFMTLNGLVSDARIRGYISGRICRHIDLRYRRIRSYLAEVFYLDHVTLPGLVAALFVLWIWFGYLRKLDVFEPEKLGPLVQTLLLGMAFSMLCGFLYDMLDFVLGLRLGDGILNDLLYCIAGIGVIEETVKIIPFLLMLRFSRQINESIDYIIYAAVSALGFAFMENLIYFQDPGPTAITGRTLSSVMLHMSLSAMVAYGLFYAKYRKNNKHAASFFLLAFITACILHGLYDFWLMAKDIPSGTKMFSVCILLFSVIIFSKMIENALNHSEFNPEKQKRIEGLSRHLVYSLSGVLLLQYLLVGWMLGISNANFQIVRVMFAFYLPLFVIFGNLGTITVEKDKWVSLFRKQRVEKEKAAGGS